MLPWCQTVYAAMDGRGGLLSRIWERLEYDRAFPMPSLGPRLRGLDQAMFKRLKPLIIHGRPITDPLAVELAQFMNDDRACTWPTCGSGAATPGG